MAAEEATALNWTFILAVAAGGSLGSVACYLVGIGFGRLLGSKFPRGVLFINISGSFLIGALAGLFAFCDGRKIGFYRLGGLVGLGYIR
jgi:CrcB protein